MIEAALKLALVSNPSAFGLKPEEVNPLHAYITRLPAGEEDDGTLAEQCFSDCNGNVYVKTMELLKDSAAPPVRKAAKRKPQSSESVTEPITPGQIKYLGYLTYQTGAEPDYEAIKRLDKTQASIRIRELEGKLKKASK